ncbi:MAG TPA: ABC transporter permease [Chitinophaga sp.]|uniref:ABC transporter permease n=1 Tax=Chitinophaga sp. TaxID=1869181 RepID=UPI002B696265|nr:ABC transporter permease [Chitinophaga sp.]HVI48330.1 ABC transporter permease [Chitinophaga sp.]
MWKNYLKIAVRNLLKRKLYTAINIFGLSTGIACFILLALYLQNEWTYDRFNQHVDKLYRIRLDYGEKDQPLTQTAMNPSALGPQLKTFPEVKQMSRVYYSPITVRYGDKAANEKRFIYADEAFFNMFSFRLLQGNAATVLKGAGTMVVSADMARKYFGDVDPVGKTMRIGKDKDFLVTGVMANVPSNSHLKFDFVASYASLGIADTWNAPNYYTYVQLDRVQDTAALRSSLRQMLVARFGNEMRRSGATFDLVPEPVAGIHLYSQAGNSPEVGGNRQYNYLFMVVAMLLLVIASINFMNLATARSAERSREIGVRKVLGAQRIQLFRQFIAESALITFIAMITGALSAYLLLPVFNKVAGTGLGMAVAGGLRIIAILAGIFVVTTLMAGIYPALVLSGFRPVQVLKGKTSGAKGGGLRKTLVVFQFAASVFFIICTIVVERQLHYIQHKKLGLNRSQLLVLEGRRFNAETLASFKSRVVEDKDVLGVSASYDSPVAVGGGYGIGNIEGKPAEYGMDVTAIPVEKDYLKTMDMSLISGEDLTNADIQDILKQDDKARVYHFFLNETAIRQLGWSPEDALGKRLSMNGRNGTVKGVIRDFHFASMKNKIAPIIVFPEYDWFGEVIIRLAPGNEKKAIEHIGAIWQNYLPDIPYEYHFMDDEFNSLYKQEYRIAAVLSAFATVIILVSCLGLLGLAAFTVQQRTKEIGIRKVMGASVTSVVTLLSGDYIRLVLIALLIATPVAWYIMHGWLGGFAYHTSLQWWMFVAGGAVALLIAMLTVSIQSIKAAMMNPVTSLRSE